MVLSALRYTRMMAHREEFFEPGGLPTSLLLKVLTAPTHSQSDPMQPTVLRVLPQIPWALRLMQEPHRERQQQLRGLPTLPQAVPTALRGVSAPSLRQPPRQSLQHSVQGPVEMQVGPQELLSQQTLTMNTIVPVPVVMPLVLKVTTKRMRTSIQTPMHFVPFLKTAMMRTTKIATILLSATRYRCPRPKTATTTTKMTTTKMKMTTPKASPCSCYRTCFLVAWELELRRGS
mmetsp:Transcript_29984/g.87534  ORF Transcript_29984/g.87534 Transcript_29984/m.87534 type:complete len:232 (+) Transcript_29984:2701-3396(+)